jgi:magnesium-transporting ATPase (P-type)
MLTGDKLTTARQIALSCNLISSDIDTTILYINNADQSIRECLNNHLNALNEKELHYERAFGGGDYDRRGSRLSDSAYVN